jgi:hypothetical protein
MSTGKPATGSQVRALVGSVIAALDGLDATLRGRTPSKHFTDHCQGLLGLARRAAPNAPAEAWPNLDLDSQSGRADLAYVELLAYLKQIDVLLSMQDL